MFIFIFNLFASHDVISIWQKMNGLVGICTIIRIIFEFCLIAMIRELVFLILFFAKV
jgi:hypothetical protein